MVIRGRSRNTSRVKFASVTISGSRPAKALVEENVERSTTALKRVKKKLVKAGVNLSKKRGVPRYSIDEQDPNVYVRLLDGRIDRGHLVNGEFVALA